MWNRCCLVTSLCQAQRVCSDHSFPGFTALCWVPEGMCKSHMEGVKFDPWETSLTTETWPKSPDRPRSCKASSHCVLPLQYKYRPFVFEGAGVSFQPGACLSPKQRHGWVIQQDAVIVTCVVVRSEMRPCLFSCPGLHWRQKLIACLQFKDILHDLISKQIFCFAWGY